MHLVILVLLILFVVAFLSRFAPNNPYPWISEIVGALLLICDTLLLLGYAR